MDRLNLWLIILMVASAAAGTGYYIWIELQTKGELSAIGWSLIAVVWFVVIRRLIHFGRKRD